MGIVMLVRPLGKLLGVGHRKTGIVPHGSAPAVKRFAPPEGIGQHLSIKQLESSSRKKIPKGGCVKLYRDYKRDILSYFIFPTVSIMLLCLN